jgi:2-oxoisovalerate dehydrogenase E1 component beta subunit
VAVVDESQSASQPAVETRQLTVIEAVREALRLEMERDERVVVLGEDIGPLGGVFRATDGLLAQFGASRVIDTPMMELGIAGLAVGMAMRGLRPVAEIQFADFMHAAADHIISDAARIRFRTNGDASCPLVVRTAYGGGLRGGPYHSQSVEAYYAHVPGLRVVVASTPADAKGLLTSAIRHPDPVLFLEHKRTYRAIKGDVPEGELLISLDRANTLRAGGDVTVVAWGWVLHECLAAAEQLAGDGIDVEVIDPRTLNPLDADSILESARRTGRLCVVHEDTRAMGVGAEIAALASERALDDLRAPVQRVAMPDVAGIPASGPMEDFVIPDRTRIGAALRALVRTDRAERVNGRGFTPAPPSPPSELAPASSVVEVDLSLALRRLEAERPAWEQRGLDADSMALFADALVQALQGVPHANAAYESSGIRRYAGVHLGISVGSSDGARAVHGLIRDADTRNLLGLAVEIARIRAEGASEPPADATITLVDYGPDSALLGVPVVQPGTVAALRIGAVEERLVVRDRGFMLAPTAYVTASIDHRALDGKDAGALLATIKRHLEAPDAPA